MEQTGFFCMMSKKKSDGYQRKLRWLQARFQEGLRIKMLPLPERGFIEYISGDYAWRPIADARDYFFIHCLWVVGKSRGQGFARLLLDACVQDARRSGRRGVAMITSEGNWLISRKMLESYGFKSVEQYAADSMGPFDLMVLPFKNGKSPTFTGHLKKTVSRAAPGFTVVRSDQCPYLSDATEIVRECARELKVPFRIVDLQSAADVRAQSASPYGVFQILFNGRILSYHYELKKDLLKKAIATQNAPG
ncbi:MAG: GNAT family N-acetyltransferase [Leptospiraceae bacterium]|nr:GNAT family N-acetyltransferase [Leptospiraceae bacterium]